MTTTQKPTQKELSNSQMDPIRVNFRLPCSQPKKQTTNLETTATVPRFLIVKKIDDSDFSKVSPFVIDKILYGFVGQVKNIRKTKEGLLIETVSTAQSLRLQKLEKFGEFSVEVIPHRTLNYSKGVITCRDLLNCTIEEILEELKPAGVVDAKRITTKKNDVIINTNSIIVTFNSPKLPTSIKVAFYSLKVRPFIPAPLRCFRCQRYGHTSSRCDKQQICICGMDLHEGSPCKSPVTCVNCGEEHTANSRTCMRYKEEQAVQRLKIESNISFVEARRKVRESIPNIQTSYAQAAKSTSYKDVKDIVKEMVPQIMEICTTLLNDRLNSQINVQDQIRSWSSNVTTSSTSQVQRSGSISSEKRKRGGETPNEDSENEHVPKNRATSEKRKPGRPKKYPDT